VSYLLFADDNEDMRLMLRDLFHSSGHEVCLAEDGLAALASIREREPDLVILDHSMPGMSGFEVCRNVKRNPFTSRIPVLMLTAQSEIESKIEGFAAGADDYLAKPFEPQELSLRIAAILRRSGPPAGEARSLSLGDCAFDLDRAELTCAGQLVRLTEGETRLLKRLAQSPHMPVDRLELGEGEDVLGRGVDVQVTRLRRKIEPDPKNPRYLQTVRGVGYRLAPD
jgi:two-component system phosphate regulon response regulator OmpR